MPSEIRQKWGDSNVYVFYCKDILLKVVIFIFFPPCKYLGCVYCCLGEMTVIVVTVVTLRQKRSDPLVELKVKRMGFLLDDILIKSAINFDHLLIVRRNKTRRSNPTLSRFSFSQIIIFLKKIIRTYLANYSKQVIKVTPKSNAWSSSTSCF